jgi:acetyl esterase/lipase
VRRDFVKAKEEGARMMHQVFLGCGVLAICVSSVAAQLPSPVPEVAAQAVQVDRYPAHAAIFANGVKGVPGVVYWTQTGYRPLMLDLYLPPKSLRRPAAGFPLVVLIHGGGWMGTARIGSPHALRSNISCRLKGETTAAPACDTPHCRACS